MPSIANVRMKLFEVICSISFRISGGVRGSGVGYPCLPTETYTGELRDKWITKKKDFLFLT